MLTDCAHCSAELLQGIYVWTTVSSLTRRSGAKYHLRYGNVLLFVLNSRQRNRAELYEGDSRAISFPGLSRISKYFRGSSSSAKVTTESDILARFDAYAVRQLAGSAVTGLLLPRQNLVKWENIAGTVPRQASLIMLSSCS